MSDTHPREPVRIADADPGAAALRRLIDELDAYQRGLYPEDSNHLDPPGVLAGHGVIFLGAFQGEDVVGCGAVKVLSWHGENYGEIKRMYVTPEYRGRGLSRRLLSALEQRLRARGVTLARLETGVHQASALALYRRAGYLERPPFGDYAPDPLSVFMEKRLRHGI